MGVIPIGGLSSVTPARATRLRLGTFRGSLVTFLETLRLAVDSLRAHKLRSFLTLLGVILAVAVLVVVMSFVAGMNVYVADKIANLGANVFIVDRFGIITSNDAWVKAQKRPLVTMDEYERLKENMKTAKAVAALDDHNVDVRSGNEKMTGTDVMGVSPNYADVRSITIAEGRFTTQSDDDHRAEVVVIGSDVAAKLFPNVDPVGKAIRAETHEYQVIGVASPIGSAFGQSQDNFLIMPIHTFERELHRQRDWIAIFVQAPSAEMMEATQDEARMLMRAWRHLPYDAPDNFAFMVVGGIVIMNIMLASVTERTREIGIRRSLGARKKHILFQFMTESGMLAAMGGVIGLITAYAFVLLIRALTFIPVEMQTSAIIISLVISTLIGLFFVIFPAMRAAKLDPIEALRADG